MTVDRKRAFLINLAYFAAVLAVAYLVIAYAFWPVFPFALAFVIAMLLQKPLEKTIKRTRLRRGAASAILVTLCLTVVLAPLTYLLIRLGMEIKTFFNYLMGLVDDIPGALETFKGQLLDFLKFLPANLFVKVENGMDHFITNFNQDFSLSTIDFTKFLTPIKGALSAAKGIPGVLFGAFMSIIATYFLTKDFPRAMAFLSRQMPKRSKAILREVKDVCVHTVFKMLRAYLIIMLLTFAQLWVGLQILALFHIISRSYLTFIALGIAFFDILPVLGSGGVLIPWALYGLITGNYKLAVGMILIYIIISVIRQFMEPKIVGNQLGLHPLITLMCLYFGLKLFGFVGMFLLPLIVMVLKALQDSGKIHIWNRRGEAAPEPMAEKETDAKDALPIPEGEEPPSQPKE